MNEWLLTVDDLILNAMGPVEPSELIPNGVQITYAVQSETGKLFAIKDLAKTFCSMPLSTVSLLQFASISEGT